MSHYTVAVITRTDPRESDELERLLAPFDENMEVERYLHRTKAQIIEDGKKHKEEMLERLKEFDKDKLIEILTNRAYRWWRDIFNCETDEDFYKMEAYQDMIDTDSGDEYTTYNPNSRWDWYEVGGRWSEELRDYEGEYWNTLQIKDWDYNYIDAEEINECSRYWDIAVKSAEMTEEEKEKFFFFHGPEYYLEKYGNKSNYVKSVITFHTYAVLTPDGEWLAPGNVVWFGGSDAKLSDESNWEKNYTSLIDTFDRNYYVTLVDCHI